MEDLQHLWTKVFAHLEKRLSKPSFETWIRNTNLIELNKKRNTATIEAPNEFARDWLESRYKETIKESLHLLTGKNYNINFIDNRSTSKEKVEHKSKHEVEESSYFSQRYSTVIFPEQDRLSGENSAAIDELVKEQRRTNQLLELILEKLENDGKRKDEE